MSAGIQAHKATIYEHVLDYIEWHVGSYETEKSDVQGFNRKWNRLIETWWALEDMEDFALPTDDPRFLDVI